MADINKIRREAEELIRRGVAEFETCQSTGRPLEMDEFLTDDEYFLKYKWARDLLLKYGYEQELDADVQGIYSELIPDCEDSTKEKKTSLKQIHSRNTETRLAAATYLCKQARWEWSFYREFWLKHPETVESLIGALQVEASPKVARQLIIALGALYERYFQDLRIFPVLFSFFDSKDKTLQHAAVLWTRSFPNGEKWPKLLAILESKTNQPILTALCDHVHAELPVSLKRELQPLLLRARKRKLNDETLSELTRAMLHTVDKSTVVGFREMIKAHAGLGDSLVRAIESYTIVERNQFLRAELLDGYDGAHR